jgi:hypothetical protein
MVKMYCIEYINKRGVRDWLGNWFFSKRAAHRFAKRNVHLIGTNYTIKGM